MMDLRGIAGFYRTRPGVAGGGLQRSNGIGEGDGEIGRCGAGVAGDEVEQHGDGGGLGKEGGGAGGTEAGGVVDFRGGGINQHAHVVQMALGADPAQEGLAIFVGHPEVEDGHGRQGRAQRHGEPGLGGGAGAGGDVTGVTQEEAEGPPGEAVVIDHENP